VGVPQRCSSRLAPSRNSMTPGEGLHGRPNRVSSGALPPSSSCISTRYDSEAFFGQVFKHVFNHNIKGCFKKSARMITFDG